MTNIKDQHMKWFGWGDENKDFNINEKPNLWPYIVQSITINDTEKSLPVPLEKITLPAPRLHSDFMTWIQSELRSDQIQLNHHARLVHSYGKSFRDLWRIRRGILSASPDCVCYPESEEEVKSIIDKANQYEVIVIPFGGGTNIAGCLEVKHSSPHMVLSMDMRRMNKVISIDRYSMTARIQAGALGPDLEVQLNEEGLTLGHFPDSFEYSSLGGWVATRSAGMQSDKYGKIEDMVLGLRLVSPSGIITTRQVPKSSNGINVNHLCIGSEGILGVITEVTMQIHPLPDVKLFYGYLFPNFEQGVHAIRESVSQGITPSMTRLNDVEKTLLSFAYKTKGKKWDSWMTHAFKSYLKKLKGFNFNEACLMLVVFEGTTSSVKMQKRKLNAIYKKFGGVSLGKGPGLAFEKGKYDFPYLRDFIMDHAIVADVSETATVWENLLPLYYKTRAALIASTDKKIWCGCHISHTYHTGASLYFTFAFKPNPENALDEYQEVKNAAENTFMKYGGTLSHHHAVGYEHIPWVAQDLSEVGIKAIEGIKKMIDPKGIMNPGKIIPT